MGYSSGCCRACLHGCACAALGLLALDFVHASRQTQRAYVDEENECYHHSELSEGERRGRGVAGGIVSARKEKMKNSEKRSVVE